VGDLILPPVAVGIEPHRTATPIDHPDESVNWLKLLSELGGTVNKVYAYNWSDVDWTTAVDYSGKGVLVGYWFHFPDLDGVRLRITVDGVVLVDFTSDVAVKNYAYYEDTGDCDVGHLDDLPFKRFNSSLLIEILSGTAAKAVGIAVIFIT